MTGYLLLLCSGLLASAGQLCQKQAAWRWKQEADIRASGRFGKALPWLVLACLCLGLGLLVWLAVLQRLPVGRAYPMLSINFVLVALCARLIFKESACARHWLGISAITAGVLLLGISA